MSSVNSNLNVNKRLMITVNKQGELLVKGRAMDMMGMVFKIQEETGKIAQDRLSFTAKELFDANKKTKMLVSFLNSIRGIRPTGGPTSTASAAQIKGAVQKFEKNYGENPFTKLNILSFSPPLTFEMKNRLNGKSSSTSFSVSEGAGGKLTPKVVGGNAMQYGALTRAFGKNFLTSLPLYKSKNGVVRSHNSYYGSISLEVTKGYGGMQQAKMDQLIEGIKSQISNVGSQQELLQNDVQRYTRLSDETNEAMSSMERSVFNTNTTLVSKI